MSSFMSMLGFDCAMPRDRSGLCGGVRTKPFCPTEACSQDSSRDPREPMHSNAEIQALWQELQRHDIIRESATYNMKQMPNSPAKYGYDLRIPVGMADRHSQYSASSCPSSSRSHQSDSDYKAKRALNIYELSVDGNLELPRDFFSKLAALIAKDDGVYQLMMTGDISACSTCSLPSQFLKRCLGEQTQEARQLWKSLDVQSRQDLLLTHECGPPTPQFFADMMMQRGSPSIEIYDDYSPGSYSTYIDNRSDTTYATFTSV